MAGARLRAPGFARTRGARAGNSGRRVRDGEAMSRETFQRARELALRLAGIELLERHREILERRARRLGLGQGSAFADLLDRVEAGDADARRTLFDLVTTKFTEFFRHPGHFERAVRQVVVAVAKTGRARLWCAAAATGEEPLSMAMALVERFGWDGPPVSLLATDLDEQALAVGAAGDFGEVAMTSLDAARRERFFAAAGRGRWAPDPRLRRMVRFRPLNLVGAEWPEEGPFEVIFCRNVLMYLEAGRRREVVRRLAGSLVPDGMLALDPTEHLGGVREFIPSGEEGVHLLGRPSGPIRGTLPSEPGSASPG